MVQETYDQFLEQHQAQFTFSGIPKHFWSTIFQKVLNQIFDAGNIFSLMKIEHEREGFRSLESVWQLQIKSENIDSTDPQHIYLVDHAWTFQIEYARKQLIFSDTLRTRMASIMGFNSEMDKSILSEKIFNEMWKFCNFYSISNAVNVEDRLSVWFVMDEVGSAIQHSDSPNFRVVPFIYLHDQVQYSLIFPIKNLSCGDIVYRDYTEGVVDEIRKSALSIPWKSTSFLNNDYEYVNQGANYFLSGHVKESVPLLENFSPTKREQYKVYTEYPLIKEYLSDHRFEVVDNENNANILWYTKHFKDFETLSCTPEKFVNQFPFEYILTIKDLLCITCRRKNKQNFGVNLESYPKWLPATYNLQTEAAQYVSYYQRRENLGFDNHWIVKPFNLARSLDTYITDNLNFILRLSTTGPKVAQKYIENPVLFDRTEISGKVKFDVRYVILLKSTKPLQVYVYRNFFLRFANQPFELKDFDEYEKHFTVMNYTEKAVLKRMLCLEFKEHWSRQYPNITWDSIEVSIFNMLREVFECAMVEDPPCGISESPQSRALYAADIMLEWNKDGTVQPKLLEINWTPDCKRACEYYQDFYNDIFKLLFLDEVNTDTIQEL